MYYLFFLLVLCGCGIGIPQSISFDPLLTDYQRQRGADAIHQWCEAVGFCPYIVPSDGEAHVIGVHGQANPNDPESIGYNDGYGIIKINTEFLDNSLFRTMVFGTIAHELGHFAISDHIPDSPLMRAAINDVDLDCIDELAARVWCLNANCIGHGTCIKDDSESDSRN